LNGVGEATSALYSDEHGRHLKPEKQ
jgi:hypothetical protein